MTSFETFWISVMEGRVAVAIPICDAAGNLGVSAAGLPLNPGSKAESMAFSEDGLERAKLAIVACAHLQEMTERTFRNIRARG